MTNRPVLAHYGPPVPPPSTTRETLGKVLTVIASIVGPPGAAFLGVWGYIEYTGCFLGCNDTGNEPLGAALFALAAAVLLVAPVLAAALVRSGKWVLATLAVPVLELLALVTNVW